LQNFIDLNKVFAISFVCVKNHATFSGREIMGGHLCFVGSIFGIGITCCRPHKSQDPSKTGAPKKQIE
jgi:hypothetical protein